MNPRDSQRLPGSGLRSDRTSADAQSAHGYCAGPQAGTRFESSAAHLLERLREVCGGRSYRQIARDTGNHPETVRRYVNGRSTPSTDFIASICEVYCVSADWLVCGRGKKMYPDSCGTTLAAASVEQLCETLSRRVQIRDEDNATKAVSEMQAKNLLQEPIFEPPLDS